MNVRDVNPPRGMRDLLPASKAARERTLAVIRREFSRFGFQEIETPAVEDLGRLTSSDGGDNEKLIFRIMKRELDPATPLGEASDLGLRFDLTVPLARYYATHRADLPAVFRSMQIGSVWRAERPQKGRYRQFTQCDLDVIGEPSSLAEMELITATLRTLEALGLKDCQVRLNDRRLLLAMLAHCGFPEETYGRVLVIVDKLDKIGLDGVERELRDAGYPSNAVGSMLGLVAKSEYAPGAPVDDVRAIADAVEGLHGAGTVRLDPTLVRGMGYYTGPIFEIAHPGSRSSIAGGGRYDGMIGRFAGQDVPACGFSIGFERIIELVTLDSDDAARVLALVYDADVNPARLVALQSQVIAEGWSVRLVPAAKRTSRLLDSLQAEGLAGFAFVTSQTTTYGDLSVKEWEP